MSRTGLASERLSTQPVAYHSRYTLPNTYRTAKPTTAPNIAARIVRATGSPWSFRPGGNEASRRAPDVLFLKQIARGVAPAFALCVEDV